MLHYIQASTEEIVLQNTTSYIDLDIYPKKYKIWLLFYIDTLEKAIHCIHEDYLTLLWYTGGCMSKGTKKAKIHHFSGYASNFKSSIYVIKLLKTNSSR